MTDQEINVKIAEAVGWKLSDDKSHWVDPMGFYPPTGHYLNFVAGGIPSYTTDLNAMAQAEETLKLSSGAMPFGWFIALQKSINPCNCAERATARQRAEAFLRTLNKWEEK